MEQKQLPTYFKVDNDDYFERRCAKDFWFWKAATWFAFICFIALLGATIGVIYLSVRA